MNRPNFQKAFYVGALYVGAMTLALASGAQAGVLHAFVNAVTGNDSNTATNCAATTPCKTFGMAYTVLQSGGEIVAMTPGGYGPISIISPLTIIGVDGATVTASTGVVGITINAPGSTVMIRNLQITGAGEANSTGILLASGTLVLRDSGLKLLTTGLQVGTNSATAHADVINTDFIGNGTAMITNGAGVNTAAGGNPPFTGTQTMVRMNGINSIGNTTAFAMQHAAADVNQNCENTFWSYSGSVINVTGDTTFFTFSPSSPPFNCNIQSYTTGTASN
jgi:hypothetical protein